MRTSAGTACGEYLRRYWQPVALTREIEDVPRLIRVLGEELVLPNYTQAGAAFSADGYKPIYYGRTAFSRWVVPIDDETMTAFAWAIFGERVMQIQFALESLTGKARDQAVIDALKSLEASHSR